jgi:hypothetical protein
MLIAADLKWQATVRGPRSERLEGQRRGPSQPGPDASFCRPGIGACCGEDLQGWLSVW